MTVERELATAKAEIQGLKDDLRQNRDDFRAFLKDEFNPLRERLTSVNGAIGWAMGACAGLGAILAALAGWFGHWVKP